jgi:hypothetical protein
VSTNDRHGAWGRGHGVKDKRFRDSGINGLRRSLGIQGHPIWNVE